MARGVRVAAAVVLLAAACAADPSLDVGSVLDGIPGAIVPDAPTVVTDVDCPDLEEGTVAQQFSCRAALNGDQIDVDVDIDEEGVVRAVVVQDLLDLEEVQQMASTRLTADLSVEIEVECPGTVVVARVRSTVACTGSFAGRERDLVVEIVDDTGGWEISFSE